MSTIETITNQQKEWAAKNNVELRDAEHTRNIYDNLYGRSLYRI